MTSRESLAAVKRGAKLLDKKFGPNWFRKIKSSTLDLESCRLCVLGQLYAADADEYEDGFDAGLRILNGEVKGDPTKFGFDQFYDEKADWDQLTALWKSEIAARRRASRAAS